MRATRWAPPAVRAGRQAWLMIDGLAVGSALTLVDVPALYATMVEVFRVRPVAMPDEAA